MTTSLQSELRVNLLQRLKWTAMPGMRLVASHFDLLLASLLILLAQFWGTNLFSPVRLDKEKIEVWVADGQIQVLVLYHYRNRTLLLLSYSLGLPFPVDPEHPSPSVFSITEMDASGNALDAVKVRSYHGSNVFRFNLWPK